MLSLSNGVCLLLRAGVSVDYISVFFQPNIVHTIAVCVICTFFTAHLIWLIERTVYGKTTTHSNYDKEGFNRYYLDGLKDGM